MSEINRRNLVERFRDEYSAKFSTLVRERFATLAADAQVDVAANRQIVAEVKAMDSLSSVLGGRKSVCTGLMMLGFLFAISAVFGLLFNRHDSEDVRLLMIFGGASLAFGCVMLIPRRLLSRKIERLESLIAAGQETGYRQMEGLNALYTRELPLKLIESVVPALRFDRCLTEARYDELTGRPDWDASLFDDKSMVCVLAGEANGYPFAFGQYLSVEWGDEEYAATMEISWNEWERDAEGKREKVRCRETLTATVSKPKPFFKEKILLVYGEYDAALGRCRDSVAFCPHLADATVNTDPETFRNWDFDAAEAFFIEFCEKLFKDVYIALVPLMAAPPMVRPGTSEDGSGANAGNVAPWEYEVLLQHADAEKVSPPDCATRCILKARLLKREDGRSTLSVHADGFRAEERTECQTVRGNDHKFHNIDVPWLEYFPVDRTCTVRLREGRNPVDSFSRRAVELEIVE